MIQDEDPHRKILAQIAELKTARPELKPLLDYYQAVLEAQGEVRTSFQPNLKSLDLDACLRRNSKGRPFLNPEDIHVDWTLFDGLLDRVIRISREHGEVFDGVGSLPPASDSYDDWHEGLLAGFLVDKTLLRQAAGRNSVEPEMFTFLAYQAVTPFLEAYAGELKGNIEDASWLRGRCPVCGAEPSMGLLEEETGKRYLQCNLCRTDWSFKRLECPFCGNDDQETLRFFYDENDEVYRVEVCDRCKRYLKTADARKAERDINLVVENLATIHLDLVALREGFQGGISGLPGSDRKPSG